MGLNEEMATVDRKSYRSRIERVDSLLDSLTRQDQLDRDLVAEYDKAIRILGIELETGSLANDLDSEVMRGTMQRLFELEALRDANREATLQLEAREEVEQLLRRGASFSIPHHTPTVGRQRRNMPERVRAKIMSDGTYADGADHQYIAVPKASAGSFPYKDGEHVSIELEMGGERYQARVRTTSPQSIAYVTYGLIDANGRDVRLVDLLAAQGFARNEEITLEVDGNLVRVLGRP